MSVAEVTEPVEVFAGNMWQAGMVKSLLENAEIEAFLQDAIIGTLNPWWTSAGGVASVRVFVAPANEADARLVVQEYLRNTAGDA